MSFESSLCAVFSADCFLLFVGVPVARLVCVLLFSGLCVRFSFPLIGGLVVKGWSHVPSPKARASSHPSVAS